MISKTPTVFAVKHKDFETRMESRSGGIFTALSDYFLDNNGVVYGCVLKDKLTAVHTRAETKEERNKMRGSKYIQSEMGSTFKSVQQDLQSNRPVLYSGTSCQVAGLKAFLGKEYDNLFCVDIVCHGVPSPLVWKKYVEWIEQENNASVVSVDFRNKKNFGWSTHIESLTLSNGNQIDSEIFKNLFYAHNILRPCCYKCPYKSTMHPGDITIADYWGIEIAAPDFSDNKGVSLVLVNNSRGMQVFNVVSDSLIYKETRIEDSLQPPLKAPFERPDNRDKFWRDFHKKDFGYIAQKYTKPSFSAKLKKKIKRLIKKVLK